jgi:hypothetical protein
MTPENEDWNCAVDGCEFEQQGEYDPDTGSYPWMQCTHCGETKDWIPDDMDDY